MMEGRDCKDIYSVRRVNHNYTTLSFMSPKARQLQTNIAMVYRVVHLVMEHWLLATN